MFGRIAAMKGLLSYCIIDEADMARGDKHVQDVIQADRLNWKRQALDGRKHGFIILAVSRSLANAQPGELLQRIALRLCELYLGKSGLNEILYDLLYLRVCRSEFRSWRVGVNYFSSQGDGRWWQDHRFPGGVAFSMNSVGHMARKLAEVEIIKKPELATLCKDVPREQLARFALRFAMQTIMGASKGPKPGTRLLQREEATDTPALAENDRVRILGHDLERYNENEYAGWYHTDESIPREFFDPTPEHPVSVIEKRLAFTYLHSEKDPDFLSMGLGEDVSVLANSILQELGMLEEQDKPNGNETK